jgi:hypothetical protein
MKELKASRNERELVDAPKALTLQHAELLD